MEFGGGGHSGSGSFWSGASPAASFSSAYRNFKAGAHPTVGGARFNPMRFWRSFRFKQFRPGEAILKLLAWLGLAGLFAATVLAALVGYYSLTLPDPREAGIARLPPNLTILASDGGFIAERGMRRGYVRYADLPAHLVNAAIAAEDRRFRYHMGFDLAGIARAAIRNWQAGHVVQGGSTITQQLAKNLFLRPRRRWTRKFEEIILALWLETRFSKNEIAELYFNRVYFGAGNYGIGAAAYHYFGKESKDLTLAESALLVGLIKAPSHYSPSHNLQGARERARSVLAAMAAQDMIPLEAYGLALAQPASFHTLPATPGFEHVIDWIVELVPELAGETQANLIVETSLDMAIQNAAREAIEATIAKRGHGLNANQAAMVVTTPSGQVKALHGGRDYQASQFNRAVKARRQPGSAFKPFIYLAALEQGMTPETLVNDTPLQIGKWRPGNYAGVYRGPIPLSAALAQSSNMAALRLMHEVGVARVIAAARRLGLSTNIRPHPTLALGTSDVTLLEMTGAFAAFASGGFAAYPQIIDRIRDENGKVIYERSQAAPSRAISAQHAASMNFMLHGVVEQGTARGARLKDHAVSGKTGTSQKHRDAWFIGFTTHFVGGVWFGNDDNAPMRGVTGGMLPAEVWRLTMAKAHEGLEKGAPLPGVHPMRPPADALAAELPLPVRRPEAAAAFAEGAAKARPPGASRHAKPPASRNGSWLPYRRHHDADDSRGGRHYFEDRYWPYE